MSLTDEVQFEDDLEPAQLPKGSGIKYALVIVAIFLMVLAGLFVVAPAINWGGLPTCDSREVKDLLVNIVHGMAIGEDLISIDGHHEIRFDDEAEIRYGQCVAHTRLGDMSLDYQVSWENRETSMFAVRIIPAELPAYNHPIVLKLLEKVVRLSLKEAAIDSIDGHREIRFDPENEIRFCRCVVHTADTELEINYLIEWQNRANAEIFVRIPPSELPACDSPEVIDLLAGLVRKSPGREKVTEIDGYQELRFDPQAEVRFAQCTLHTPDGTELLRYAVRWGNRDTGYLLVQVLPDELPECTDPEVIKLVEQLLKSIPAGDEITSINGYRELRFDKDASIRFGQCTVHQANGSKQVNYLVEWGDREVGYYLVRIPPVELPACDSPEVIRILEQIIQNAPVAAVLTSIDGHRELRVDDQLKVRYGRCVVHTTQGDFEALFKIDWKNEERGLFQLLITEEKPLP